MPHQIIKGKDVQRGQVIQIYGTTRVAVESIRKDDIWGGIQLQGLSGEWFGISEDEDVQLLGTFNVE